jgi:hypothetical protein
MPRSDDIAALHTRKPGGKAQPMGWRQGFIVAWNPVTLENKIRVGGAELVDLPVYGVAEAVAYKVGATVILHEIDNQLGIAGRLVIPGTAGATEAISLLSSRTRSAITTGFQVCTSTTFGDLTTVGPTVENVVIGASGRALIVLSARVEEISSDIVRGGEMGYDMSGATSATISGGSDNARALVIGNTDDGDVDGGTSSNNLAVQGAFVDIREGLNPGLHTFVAKYRLRTGSAGQVTFGNRSLTVIAL